jgi:hypothetical protein
MADRADVILESECSSADLMAVIEVFERAGIPADVTASYARRSAAELPWLVIIGISAWGAGTFVKAALEGVGDEAGRAGWRALMRLVKALYKAREPSRASEGTISIKLSEPPLEIPLPPDLPETAYRRLWETEDPRAPLSGILIWDSETEAWLDALARRNRCDYPSCQEWATQGRKRLREDSYVEQCQFCDLHAGIADIGNKET